MEVSKYNQMMAYLTRPRERFSNGGALNQKYLYKNKRDGTYEVKSKRDGTYKLFPKNKLKEAKAFAKKLEEKFAKVDLVGLGTEDLAKKLGVSKNTIFTFKSRDSEVFKNIKKYFNVKQKSSTTPARYVLKKGINLKDAIQDIKSSIGAPGGKGTKKATYRGKETTISQVKNVLLKSKKPLNPDQIKELLPNMNTGTIANNLQILKNDESVANKIKRFERGAKETSAKIRQTVAETNAPFMKAIRDQLVLDPDSDTEDLAKALFGDKKYNAVKGTAEQIRLDIIAERQLPKFLALFSKGATTTTPGFKDIPPDKLGDIIESLETRLDEFGSLDAGDRRRLMLSIADTKRNLPERATETAIGFLKQPGKEVDEVVGVSSTYNRAPGYIEATQVIDSKINQLKAKQIDSPFSKEFQKVLDGDYSGYKKYNQKARAFAKKYNVDVPIIKIGEDLQPEKFVSNFKDFSPEAQKNIKQIAKDKGVVIQTKSKPLFSFSELGSGGDTAKFLAALGCPGKAMGGRIGFQEGTIPSTQCVLAGANIVNDGNVKNLSQGQRRNLSAFLNRAYKLGRGVAKFGVVPEAIFVAGESLLRIGMGDTLDEAFLRATDYLRTGDQTLEADANKISRTLFDQDAGNLFKSVSNFRKAKKNLEGAQVNLDVDLAQNDPEFSGMSNEAIRKIGEDRIKKAKDDFFNAQIAKEQQVLSDYQFEQGQDISKAKSFLTAQKLKGKQMEAIEDDPLQIDLSLVPEQKKSPLIDVRSILTETPKTIADKIQEEYESGAYGQSGLEESFEKAKQDYRNTLEQYFNIKDAPLSELAASSLIGAEQIYGPNPENFLQKRLPAGASYDPRLAYDFAGGGIAKLAGVDSGPPPEKGPTPQGLDFLLNRGRR